MTATTLKLSDLAGPDADGWSDVAVFVRADGSDEPHVPPFVVKSFFHFDGAYMANIQHADGSRYERYADRYPVRRLGRGRLVPARIEMEVETGADLAAQVRTLRQFARECAMNFDCDNDAHRYQTLCRKCEARAALAATSPTEAAK